MFAVQQHIEYVQHLDIAGAFHTLLPGAAMVTALRVLTWAVRSINRERAMTPIVAEGRKQS